MLKIGVKKQIINNITQTAEIHFFAAEKAEKRKK
jgi:hypothetical protein